MLEDFQALAQGHCTETQRMLEEFEDEHLQLAFAPETYKKEHLHANKDEREDEDKVTHRLPTPPLEPGTQSKGLRTTDGGNIRYQIGSKYPRGTKAIAFWATTPS